VAPPAAASIEAPAPETPTIHDKDGIKCVESGEALGPPATKPIVLSAPTAETPAAPKLSMKADPDAGKIIDPSSLKPCSESQPAAVALAARAETPAQVERTTMSAARSIQSENSYGALQLNDRTFNDVVNNKGLMMVDFHAHWCGPCRRMGPVVDALASEMKRDTVIAKVDVDEAPATASRFGVHSIPCFIIFHDGHEIGRRYGSRSMEDLRSLVR